MSRSLEEIADETCKVMNERWGVRTPGTMRNWLVRVLHDTVEERAVASANLDKSYDEMVPVLARFLASRQGIDFDALPNEEAERVSRGSFKEQRGLDQFDFIVPARQALHAIEATGVKFADLAKLFLPEGPDDQRVRPQGG